MGHNGLFDFLRLTTSSENDVYIIAPLGLYIMNIIK